MLRRSVSYKTPVGKKCPLKAVALAARTEWFNKWKCRKSLCDGLSWKYKMGCNNPGDSPIVHGRVRDDVEKQWEEQQQNEKYRQMKIQQQQNEDDNQHHKNLLGDSPKPSTITGSFWLLILKKIITELIITKKFLYKNFIKHFFWNIYNKKIIKNLPSPVSKFFLCMQTLKLFP